MTSFYSAFYSSHAQLYTADGDKKSVFPIVFEDVSLEESEAGRGVKFVISGVNWTMCRPGVDDYNHAISRLMQGMKDRGASMRYTPTGMVSSEYCDCV